METRSTASNVANLTPARSGTAAADYEQPPYSRRDTVLTMIGVLMVMLLASLDQTNHLLQRR
jgi:hypothetical protein